MQRGAWVAALLGGAIAAGACGGIASLDGTVDSGIAIGG